jgi:hypothetical protein
MGKPPIHIYVKTDEWQEVKRLAATRDSLRERRNAAMSIGIGCTVMGGGVLVVGGTPAAILTGLGFGVVTLCLHLGMCWAHQRLLARMAELEEVQ